MTDETQPRKLAVSVDEAAKIVSVGRTSLFKEIREGRLVARRATTGRTIIDMDDLASWVKSRPLVSA